MNKTFLALIAIVAFMTFPALVAQEEEAEIIAKPLDALAKDIPAYVFPNSKLVSHEKIQEGLRRTSEQRSIYRTMFLCPGNPMEVEEFYRIAHRRLSVAKLKIHDFHITRFKIDARELGSEVEIVLYTTEIPKGSHKRKARQRQLRRRLQKLRRPVAPIDKEIASLRRLQRQGKLSRSVMEARIAELQRRRTTMTNSPSYWDAIAMERSLVASHNILMVTQVKKHGIGTN